MPNITTNRAITYTNLNVQLAVYLILVVSEIYSHKDGDDLLRTAYSTPSKLVKGEKLLNKISSNTDWEAYVG